MKAFKSILCIVLMAAMIGAVVVAGAAFLLDMPMEQRTEKREVIVDHGVPGSTTATHVYIDPYIIGPGKYVYVYADRDTKVIGYREELP